jgi:hypothetical protein
MARVVELRRGEFPPPGARHALVIASPVPPVECVPVVQHGSGVTFFALNSERDILIMVGRAQVWADERMIAVVYVRRETLADTVQPANEGLPQALERPSDARCV